MFPQRPKDVRRRSPEGRPENVGSGRPWDVRWGHPQDVRWGRPQDGQIGRLGDVLGTLVGDVLVTSWGPVFAGWVISIRTAGIKKELSVLQRQKIIKFIERKKRKDKRFIKNWRPISLLNVDYKIGSKALAEGFKKFLQF